MSAPVAPQVARPSVASLLLHPTANGNPLAAATGFVVERNSVRWLITNWHVVAGRRPDTGDVLSSTGGVPDQLVIAHNRSGALGQWVPKTEDLYDGAGLPRWLEHPTHGRTVDVVALELEDVTGVDFYEHDPKATQPDVAVGVARSLSIIGFPFGQAGGGALGIWVQASIATEPEIDFEGRPCFLVDSRTRPGQSGSPVVFYSRGGTIPMANGSTAVMAGEVERLFGVYSGRINDQSDLGFVWKCAAIESVLEHGVSGSV